MRGATVIFALIVACASARGATVRVEFPLGEHYRVGRFLPVRVHADIGDATLLVGGPGTIPIQWKPGRTPRDAIVPLLAVLPVETVTYSFGSRSDDGADVAQRFRALADDERLIGTTIDSADSDELERELFPDQRVVDVSLDLADPLPGPPAAWGALDAVLLDPASAARVTERQVATLLASGTTIAIQSSEKPGGNWPWRRVGAWWVAQPAPAGPDSLLQPEAYNVLAAGSARGWPASFRRTIFLACGAFCLAAMGASLWRSKRAWLAVAALSLTTAGAIALWRPRQDTAALTVGGVSVASPQFTQRDIWWYRVANATGSSEHSFQTDASADAVVRPVFASPRHFRSIDIRLACRPDGPPLEYVAQLHRDQSVVFLERSISPTSKSSRSETSYGPADPIAAMAREMYLTRNDRIIRIDALPATVTYGAASVLPEVVIQRRGAVPTPTPAPAIAPAVPPR